MVSFDHEKLDVYRLAFDFLALADDIVERLPRGRAVLADQLQRASISIPLNVAEGAGEFSPKDKNRFYRVDARKKAGLTQAEVARRMKLPQSAVVRLESGAHSPTLMTLSRYAAAIGVKLEVRRIA